MTDTAENRAADGTANPPAAATFAQFVQLLDEGGFHEALTRDLENINATLQQHVLDNGGKPSAELAIKVKITFEDGVFRVKAEHTTKLPKEPAASAVLWSTTNNRFTVTNPKQGQLFGVRSV